MDQVIRDLVGTRYGRWVVLRRSGMQYCICRCECGIEKEVLISNLRRGKSLSCGCLARELASFRSKNAATHGHTRDHSMTPEYRAWHSMKRRCTRPTSPEYANYGGRGIKVCERWINSFEAFLSDMGLRPSSIHSLERINNDGNYEPGNCKWATLKEQHRNTRRTARMTYRGETLSIAEWAERLGLQYATVNQRWHSWKDARRVIETPLIECFSKLKRSRV